MIYKYLKILILIAFPIVLIEFTAFLYFNLFLQNRISTSELQVFQKTNPEGTIIPTSDYVVPIKKNYNGRWITREFDVDISTDDRGFREKGISNINFDKVKLAFFGDSFTFGHGVEEDERFSSISSNCLGSEWSDNSLNFSYLNGWQPEHYEFYFRNNTDLAPDFLVMSVYLGNDFYSDLFETHYSVDNNSLELPFKIVHKDGFLMNSDYAYTTFFKVMRKYTWTGKVFVTYINRSRFRSIPYKEKLFPNTFNDLDTEMGRGKGVQRGLQSIIRTDSLLNLRNTKLIVLIVPQNYYYGATLPHVSPENIDSLGMIISEPNLKSTLIKEFKQNDIAYIDPTAKLSVFDYFEWDGHWNSDGHRLIGEIICERIRNELN